jgi:HSP90 family molecular chaperone
VSHPPAVTLSRSLFSETEEIPVDDVEETEGDEVEGDGEEDEEITEEVEEAEDKPTRKVSKTVWDWELINANKPIWTRNPKEIEKEEYNKFYRAFSRESKVLRCESSFESFLNNGQFLTTNLRLIPISFTCSSLGPHDLQPLYC